MIALVLNSTLQATIIFAWLLSGDELVQRAINVRKQIHSFDITAEVESTRVDLRSNQTIRKHAIYRIIVTGEKVRVDYRLLSKDSQAIENEHTACYGCTTDGKIYYLNRMLSGGKGNSVAAALDSSFRSFLVDPRDIGCQFLALESREWNNQFELFRSPIYSAAIIDSKDDRGGYILIKSQKGTSAVLKIHVEEKYDGNVTAIEYTNNQTSTKKLSKSLYGPKNNGLYFPVKVEVTQKSTDFSMNELITFTSVSLNEPIDPSLFSPSVVNLRFNSAVPEKVGNKSKVKFYDGSKLVSFPPEPSEYLASFSTSESAIEKPNSRGNFWLYFLIAILIITAIFCFLFNYRRKNSS